jgi:K+-transporting ATPase ATPase B chain
VTGGTRFSPIGLSCASPPIPASRSSTGIIGLIEAAKRRKTPNEIALEILLAGLTIIFLLTTVTLLPFSVYSVRPPDRAHRLR